MEDYEVKFSLCTDVLLKGLEVLQLQAKSIRTELGLKSKPKNFILDEWIDFQPLINGKTLVWYYCSVLEDVKCKVI